MTIVIEIARSLNEYLQNWNNAMAHAHWFHKATLFDYIKEEMVEEITEEFNSPDCKHLLAKTEDFNGVVGVLKVKIQGEVGTLGRWEPAVSAKYRKRGVGEALIEEAFTLLRKRNIFKARCIMKFPYNQPEKADWHVQLYRKCGFLRSRPRSVLLQADLSKINKEIPTIANLQVTNGDDFSLKELAGFTQRAYLSTPKDKAIHKDDPYISNQENLLKILETIKNGKMGLSPPELWEVAVINHETAGFIIGFIPPKSKYRPLYGMIGELGVFPEYRRKGIAMFLITDAFEVFRRCGCNYSLVGTPKANHPALKLYCKMGYIPVFEQLDFEKSLKSA